MAIRVILELSKSYAQKWYGMTGGAAGDSAIDAIISRVADAAGTAVLAGNVTIDSQFSTNITAIGTAARQSFG